MEDGTWDPVFFLFFGGLSFFLRFFLHMSFFCCTFAADFSSPLGPGNKAERRRNGGILDNTFYRTLVINIYTTHYSTWHAI